MKIKEIKSQHRRDFIATYECEHCDFVKTGSGYDDSNFHKNVIPSMVCPECNKKSPATYRPLQPKYSKNQVV